MTYSGRAHRLENVSIGAPNSACVDNLVVVGDVQKSFPYWMTQAQSDANILMASQKLALKCGFTFAGGAWEDPENTRM